MMKNNQRKAESGFTLMEVLVVVALIGILAVVAFPSFSDWSQRSNLNADMRRLYSFFQKARMEAVKQNTTCSVVLDGATYVSTVGADTIYSGAYSKGVTGSAYVGSFDRRGLISTPTTITVQRANSSGHKLVINRRGKMRIE